jgi:hypothetical protein
MSRATIHYVEGFPFSASEVADARSGDRNNDELLRKITIWLNNYVMCTLPHIKRGDVLDLIMSLHVTTTPFIWSGTSVETLKIFHEDDHVIPESYVWSDRKEFGCMKANPAYWLDTTGSLSWPSASVRQKIANAMVDVGFGHFEAKLMIEGVTYTFSFLFESDFMLDEIKAMFKDLKNPLDLCERDDGSGTHYTIFPVDLMSR